MTPELPWYRGVTRDGAGSNNPTGIRFGREGIPVGPWPAFGRILHGEGSLSMLEPKPTTIRLAYIWGWSALAVGYGLFAVLFILEKYDMILAGSVLNWFAHAALWPIVGLIICGWGAVAAAYAAGLIKQTRGRRRTSTASAGRGSMPTLSTGAASPALAPARRPSTVPLRGRGTWLPWPEILGINMAAKAEQYFGLKV